MHRFKGLDLNALWTVLKSVQAIPNNVVVFTFKQQAVPYFYYIAGQTGIVAQHVWSKIKNPVTYIDKHPVGTGPFTVSSSSTPQTIVYVRNPHYWQKGKPYLSKVLYPAYTSNPSANTVLEEGQADWAAVCRRTSRRHTSTATRRTTTTWFPPIGNVDISINATVKPLNNKYAAAGLSYAV